MEWRVGERSTAAHTATDVPAHDGAGKWLNLFEFRLRYRPALVKGRCWPTVKKLAGR
jgi:hypothetical protein